MYMKIYRQLTIDFFDLEGKYKLYSIILLISWVLNANKDTSLVKSGVVHSFISCMLRGCLDPNN